VLGSSEDWIIQKIPAWRRLLPHKRLPLRSGDQLICGSSCHWKLRSYELIAESQFFTHELLKTPDRFFETSIDSQLLMRYFAANFFCAANQ
jgi:hypothetical protein